MCGGKPGKYGLKMAEETGLCMKGRILCSADSPT